MGRLMLGRSRNHKAQQLCKQVSRTLSGVLRGECGDDLLQDLEVVSVVPAPGTSHLLVTVQLNTLGGQFTVREVLERLHKVSGFLRSEVASTITRRRAPELTWRVVPGKVEE